MKSSYFLYFNKGNMNYHVKEKELTFDNYFDENNVRQLEILNIKSGELMTVNYHRDEFFESDNISLIFEAKKTANENKELLANKPIKNIINDYPELFI